MSAYRKDFDETKYMSFLIKDDELLKNMIKFGKRLKILLIKKFDIESVYNEKYLKAKIKSYNGKINTIFDNNKIPKEGAQFICLPIILIDSLCRTCNNYYPLVHQEECKYVVKEKKIPSIALMM